MAKRFQETWPKLGCKPDDFIRTSEDRHKNGVQALWSTLAARGDIYLGHFEGLYCVGCEAYFTEKDLEQPGNICKFHKKPVEKVKEPSYFFRLSRYTDRLLAYYAEHPEFVQPSSRLNEVLGFLREGLQDLSISRTLFDWGVPILGDPKHVMYVWFDALANYLTAVAGTSFWPASLHLVGKDILRFHAVFWPAFLMAAELPLPRVIFAHGFLTYGGQKMSKSLRNTVNPVTLANAISPTVGVDTVRYCLMRGISFGQDGDFSIENLIQRYHSELGNGLGNLLNRILPFGKGVVSGNVVRGENENDLIRVCEEGASTTAKAFEEIDPTRALDAIWVVVAACNDYTNKVTPWVSKKIGDWDSVTTFVATMTLVMDALSVMLAPVLPTVSSLIREQLGLLPIQVGADDIWPVVLPLTLLGTGIVGGPALFPRLSVDTIANLTKGFS